MLTLKEAMELAGTHLLGLLAPGYGYLPYWMLSIEPDHRAEWQMMWPAHNVGRWWDAMLRLEAATGFPIPPQAEQAMIKNLKACLDNPLGVVGNLLPRDSLGGEIDPAGWFDEHSQREILLALSALVRWRGASWAAEQGRQLVRALDGYIREDGAWDIPAMNARMRQAGIHVPQTSLDDHAKRAAFRQVETHGRLLEALLEFHTAAGDPAALLLAGRLARLHLAVSTRPDGSLPPGPHTHTHSYLGTLRGLLLYGQLTGQHEYIDRVALTYQNTVLRTIKRSGFISHDMSTETDGETGSVGDVVQLGLRLARSGYPAYLDDAERIVRARLLPSQITTPSGIQPTVDDGKDEHTGLDRRLVGGFGGMHRHPHGGKTPTTDITAADLHALCDVYTHIVEESPLGLRVNFHFDYEDDRISIQSTRTRFARLSIRLKAHQPLLVRIPNWAPVASVRLEVDGRPRPVDRVGRFLYIPKPAAPAEIRVEYGLPRETVDETIAGVTYRLAWQGDEVTGVAPNAAWLPFYPDL